MGVQQEKEYSIVRKAEILQARTVVVIIWMKI